MKVAICDDNKEILDFLEQEITLKFGTHFSIIRYEEADELWDDWSNARKRSDIVIMDIKFRHKNGVDVAKQLQEQYGTHIKVIFITGYTECASEIFRAQPTFLLMKPIQKELLYEALIKAEKLIKEENENAIYISFRGCIKRIKVNDIYYAESIGKKTVLYYADGTEEATLKLNEVEKQLPDFFLRVHQSFLVNMNFIQSIKADKLDMTNGNTIPISRAKSKCAREKFMSYLDLNF